MEKIALAKYQEIALKGKNRPMFTRALLQALRATPKGAGITAIKHLNSRIIVELAPDFRWTDVAAHMSSIFGIEKFSLATRLPADLDAIKIAIEEEIPTHKNAASFRIRVARADKTFPIKSKDIEIALGAFVQEITKLPVNLKHAELTITVEIVPGEAYLYFDHTSGLGGLPPGVSGKLVCLMSGGIDSPVAAFRMMTRGAQIVFVHFHAFPLLWGVSRDKVDAMLHILSRYQQQSRLYLVPFASLQQSIALSVNPRFRVIAYRRMMVRIAEAIAAKEHAFGLVTGDSLGQVASQTLENLATIDDVATIPILRPLIGMTKNEIIKESQLIGTYDTSIEPDEDCCTLFVPKNPVTRSTPAQLASIERQFDVDSLVEAGVRSAELKKYSRIE